jgi:hypothetical protein
LERKYGLFQHIPIPNLCPDLYFRLLEAKTKRNNNIVTKKRICISCFIKLLPFFNKIIFPLYPTVLALSIIHPIDTYRIHKSMQFHKIKSEAIFTEFWERVGQIGVKNMYRGFFLANLIGVVNFNFYSNLHELLTTTNLP